MGQTPEEAGAQKEESRRMAQEVKELEENSEEMGYEGSPVKAPPNHQKKDDAACATANFPFFNG